MGSETEKVIGAQIPRIERSPLRTDYLSSPRKYADICCVIHSQVSKGSGMSRHLSEPPITRISGRCSPPPTLPYYPNIREVNKIELFAELFDTVHRTSFVSTCVLWHLGYGFGLRHLISSSSSTTQDLRGRPNAQEGARAISEPTII